METPAQRDFLALGLWHLWLCLLSPLLVFTGAYENIDTQIFSYYLEHWKATTGVCENQKSGNPFSNSSAINPHQNKPQTILITASQTNLEHRSSQHDTIPKAILDTSASTRGKRTVYSSVHCSRFVSETSTSRIFHTPRIRRDLTTR